MFLLRKKRSPRQYLVSLAEDNFYADVVPATREFVMILQSHCALHNWDFSDGELVEIIREAADNYARGRRT